MRQGGKQETEEREEREEREETGKCIAQTALRNHYKTMTLFCSINETRPALNHFVNVIQASQ